MQSGRQDEFKAKLTEVRNLLEQQNLDGVLISDCLGFSWITCGGDSHITLSGPGGSGSVLVTLDNVYLVCSKTEERRLMEEEIMGLPLEPVSFPWYDGNDLQAAKEIIGSGQLAFDFACEDGVDISSELLRLRYSLMPQEIERMKWLGRQAELVLRETCRRIEPEQTEFEVAGLIAQQCYERKLLPMLTLVAFDERISQYRHPIPTDKELKNLAMVVVCARRWGLYANLTRLVSFGPVDSELRRRHDAVTLIDATMIASSRVGTSYRALFQKTRDCYAEVGFPDDWQVLHLGGPTGYDGRLFMINPDCDEEVLDGQAIAWNPTIEGTKSEDTIIVSREEITVVTEAKDWPKVAHEVDGLLIPRPDILVR